MNTLKVVLFTCNWNAYSSLEAAGRASLTYQACVHPVRVLCLGQLSPGTILKAFERGADGVLLLGCPPGSCHYEFGRQCAERSIEETRRLAALLGIHAGRLGIDSLGPGEGGAFVEKVNEFVKGLQERRQE